MVPVSPVARNCRPAMLAARADSSPLEMAGNAGELARGGKVAPARHESGCRGIAERATGDEGGVSLTENSTAGRSVNGVMDTVT